MEFIWLAIGLALLGYFIGKGVRNFGNLKKDSSHHYFLKENEFYYQINVSETEIQEWLLNYPSEPKVVLNRRTYYPLKQIQDWLHTIELNNNQISAKTNPNNVKFNVKCFIF